MVLPRNVLLKELRRRNVHRAAIAYLAGAWLVVQVVETLLPAFDWPGQVLRFAVIIVSVGFIPALIFAWVFEWTPEGLRRESDVPTRAPGTDAGRFDRFIIVVLVIAVAVFAVDKFIFDPARDRTREQAIADRARSEALVEVPADRSIVVLPFVNLSDETNSEYFSDGITEELLNLLTRVHRLRVISRTSSFAFKGRSITATEVAEQLNVTYVLEGSVRRAGPVVRITAQLVDGRSDTHLWSETYDREFELSDVLKIQDEIAQRVVDELKLSLVDHNTRAVNPIAYEAELQVRYLIDLYESENVGHIERLIEEGLQADPDYAALLWHKQRLVTHKAFWGLITEEQRNSERSAIQARLRVLDPDNVRWLLLAAADTQDPQELARLVSKAYNQAPTDEYVVENVARGARVLGKVDIAVALGKYLVDRDPLCGRCFFRLGLTYLEAQQFEQALAPLNKARVLGTGGLSPEFATGAAYLFMNDPARALDTFERVPNQTVGALGKLLASYDLGNMDEYESLRTRIWETIDLEQRAQIAAWTHDKDAAFDFLEHMYAESPRNLGTLFSDSFFMRIWDDPRWDDLMRRLGTRKSDLATITLDIEPPE